MFCGCLVGPRRLSHTVARAVAPQCGSCVPCPISGGSERARTFGQYFCKEVLYHVLYEVPRNNRPGCPQFHNTVTHQPHQGSGTRFREYCTVVTRGKRWGPRPGISSCWLGMKNGVQLSAYVICLPRPVLSCPCDEVR